MNIKVLGIFDVLQNLHDSLVRARTAIRNFLGPVIVIVIAFIIAWAVAL